MKKTTEPISLFEWNRNIIRKRDLEIEKSEKIIDILLILNLIIAAAALVKNLF